MTVVNSDVELSTISPRHPLTGLVPAAFLRSVRTPRHSTRARGRLSRSLFTAVPVLIIGSLAMTLAIATPADAAPTTKKTTKQKAPNLKPAKPATSTNTHGRATATAPANYKVQPGDTISSVAGRFGLSTASVLTLNGLGWKSLIFPGQVLKLSKAAASNDRPVKSNSYTIAPGDTVADIAQRFGVSTNSVLIANGLKSSSIIFPGQKISVPDAGSFSSVDSATVPIELVSSTVHTTVPSVTTYLIATGDTISSVAQKFGVTVHAVLEVNNMSASSLIYSGRSITIPKLSMYVSGRGTVTLLSTEMQSNARSIIATGRAVGASDRAIVIALATAMQESGLKNLGYGDLDSVGLFQQRPSKGWGSVHEILNREYSARAFFLGVGDDTAGLFDIPGWQSMTVAQAAQAVQISAFPHAYAQWESSATYWLDELG